MRVWRTRQLIIFTTLANELQDERTGLDKYRPHKWDQIGQSCILNQVLKY